MAERRPLVVADGVVKELPTGDALPGDSTVYAISGTTPALSAANGGIQTWTLTANSTPTDALSSGQSVVLMVADGTSAYTVTWPATTWVGGNTPALPTSGYAVVVLWKVGSTLYGCYVGNVA